MCCVVVLAEVRDVTDIEREFGAALRARGDTAGETVSTHTHAILSHNL